ncbi:hypothetical protein GBAR_LOCUS28156 [Geodia barretti]|uniref:Uncharacterized protein n=1 Tax=Geodia barretti TaxID=519541 RepID=A0AA35TPH7_GEOBA|nr:hypothetical protein GBAR_LOCUS28156 [Geodia barretti]
MAAEAGTTTVVFAENWGALLKYPASLRVNLVEERYGHRKSTCLPVSTKKAKKLKKKKLRTLNSGEQLQNKYHLEDF